MVTELFPAFEEFPKIARLSRNCCITEKIDGTNAVLHVTEDGQIFAGSRSRYITPDDDNYGFARWVKEHEEELKQLGEGRHWGEWWGSGVQRGYGLLNGEKRFSLFNSARWNATPPPACCHVVPVLYIGIFNSTAVDEALESLRKFGSAASPGFMNPEGVIVYQTAGRVYFKKTLHKDEEWKGKSK